MMLLPVYEEQWARVPGNVVWRVLVLPPAAMYHWSRNIGQDISLQFSHL